MIGLATHISMGITQHLVRSGIAYLEQIRSPSPSSSSSSTPSTLQNLYIRVDRSKVLSSGRAVAAQLLTSLQVYKSTADGAGARAFYRELTAPLEGWEGEVRDLVVKKKQPRKVFVQVR